jgi:outer membrane protein assembly factor BamB
VHAVAQDGSLHAMVKGNVAEGGTWPTTPLFPTVWMPHRMSGPSQGRPSGLPVATAGSTRTIFLSSQDGHVYAFNAETGAQAWVSAPLAPVNALQAHPSGAFAVFGASKDFVFVGTRDAAGSKFYALKVSDGSQAWVFDGASAGFGRIGAISGQAAVDQVTKRVYFASRAFGATPDDKTVFCVDLETGAGLWAAPRGDVDAGVSLAGGFLFVGTNDPKVKKIDTVAPNEGVEVWAFTVPPAEGPPKGYVAVDRVTGDSYFATVSSVWALKSDGTPKWPPSGSRALASPSTPVFAPQDLYVYVGSSDGKLHRIFAASGTEDTTAPFPIPLGDATAAVGSPTYDLGPRYLYVGTEAGIVYAIQLP